METKIKAKKNSKKPNKKKQNYIKGVKSEVKKVSWPSKKEVFKYTVATVVFVLFITLFFLGLNLLLAMVTGWVK